MVGWIAFGVAVFIVLLVLGYCAYQLRWRSACLQKDLAGLQEVVAGLSQVGTDLGAAQQRAVGLQGDITTSPKR